MRLDGGGVYINLKMQLGSLCEPIESGPEKYFEDAGTRTRDLSTKHAKRVRLPSALHPRWPERAHALYNGASS